MSSVQLIVPCAASSQLHLTELISKSLN